MAIKVTQYHPIDLAGVKDDGIKSLVLLAASIGYKYDWRSGKPIILFAADQTQINLSSETSINAGVFQGKLNQIMTHYDAYNYTPTIELIDAIIKQCKPNKDQQRLLRLAVGETIEETRKRMRAQEAGPATEKRHPDEHLTQRIELPTNGPVVFDFIANDVTMGDKAVEPQYTYKPHEIRFGGVRAATGAYYFYESVSVLDRVDANGIVTYVCRYCHEHGRPDYVVATPSGIGVHWGRHVKAGETEKQDRKVSTKRSDGVPVKHYSEQIRPRRHNPKPGTKAFREAERQAEREAALAETIANVVEESVLEAMAEVEKMDQAAATVTIEMVTEAVSKLSGDQKLMAIRTILDDGETAALHLENQQLRDKNLLLQDRINKLHNDLQALKDILGGIS